MLVNISLNTLGLVVFLFLFWRKLKEDYISSQIFSTSFLILLLLSVGYLISQKYFPFWRFWVSLSGVMLGLIISTLRLRLRFYETFETLIIAFIPWLSMIFLSDAITNSSVFSLIAAVVTMLFTLLYGVLNVRYKDFGWYKSGRIGFAGLTTFGIYFLVRGVVAIFAPFMLSFSGRYETILSGVVAFFLFLGVFNLSRSN